MTGRLQNRVAIVTGGASGIGAACVEKFAREGAAVAIFDLERQSAAGERLAASIDKGLFVACDVTKGIECAAAVAQAAARLGRPDILFNNAGISLTGGVDDMSEENWDLTFDVNVKSIYLVTREVLPHMRGRGGSIINMASESAFLGLPMNAAYCASKAAVVHLTRSMAVRYAPDRIRVNALCPGTIDTPLYRGFIAQQPDPAAIEKMLLSLHPLGLGTVEDIAHAAAYLASDESRYVTGSSMSVDGGSTAM